MTRVDLSDAELVLLDGRCGETVQAEVDAARDRIAARGRHPTMPPALSGLVADAATEARTNGRLVWTTKPIDYCPLCGWVGKPARYKSGPRKGEIKPNGRRGMTGGVDLAHRFVTIQHHVRLGGCRECVETAEPALRKELRGVPAQVPDRLRAEGEPKRVRYERRRCKSCGWEGHEGRMGRLTAVMGGTYPGECPDCGAKQLPLGPLEFEHVDGFDVVATEAEGVTS